MIVLEGRHGPWCRSSSIVFDARGLVILFDFPKKSTNKSGCSHHVYHKLSIENDAYSERHQNDRNVDLSFTVPNL
jgi:hypothetical protein